MIQLAELPEKARKILALLKDGTAMSQDDLAHYLGDWSSNLDAAILELDGLDLITVAHWENDEVAVWRATSEGKELAV